MGSRVRHLSANGEPILRNIYRCLNSFFGDLHWWPAETPFEVIVGAILTQNTAWKNVEKAIRRLKDHRIMDPEAMRLTSERDLATIIRPAGYFNIKTSRLKAFLKFLHEHHDGRLDRMFAVNAASLRKSLLDVKGIGPETADSILLYAGGKPTFVVDAYSRRILSRHGLISYAENYSSIQMLVVASLPRNIRAYKQFHALLVETGKDFCRKAPRCGDCPLKDVSFRSTGLHER